jgi:hypothetical protein
VPQSKRHPARRPDRRPSKTTHPRSSRAAAPPPDNRSPFRRRLETASLGPLLFMRGLPRFLVPILLGVVLLAGLALPSHWAGLLLILPALFLAWLLALSWPVLPWFARAVRVFALVVLIVAAVARIAGVF